MLRSLRPELWMDKDPDWQGFFRPLNNNLSPNTWIPIWSCSTWSLKVQIESCSTFRAQLMQNWRVASGELKCLSGNGKCDGGPGKRNSQSLLLSFILSGFLLGRRRWSKQRILLDCEWSLIFGSKRIAGRAEYTGACINIHATSKRDARGVPFFGAQFASLVEISRALASCISSTSLSLLKFRLRLLAARSLCRSLAFIQ